MGDRWAWVFPEEVTSVGREAQTSAADGHTLVSSPNHHCPHPTAEELKLQDSEGPTSQIQLAAELGLYTSLEEMNQPPRNAARARDREHDAHEIL